VTPADPTARARGSAVFTIVDGWAVKLTVIPVTVATTLVPTRVRWSVGARTWTKAPAGARRDDAV